MRMKDCQDGLEFKVTVAWAALSESKTLAELAREYGVNPITIKRWKQELLSEVANLFHDGNKSARA
jgi:transposase-like protein